MISFCKTLNNFVKECKLDAMSQAAYCKFYDLTNSAPFDNVQKSIYGTLIGCCCQNFRLKHFAISNMVMLQRDRMNNCREFRSSYGSDKQAFDILLQNIEQFCKVMQIRCKYEIQVSSFTVGMTWSFNPDIEDITFCLFWCEYIFCMVRTKHCYYQVTTKTFVILIGQC